ncbi:MAG TPA: chemotaxis protein CheW [Syntrophomonadaceae bacterium]|nr:chemotaxis protein CheW [Syntrophomonadaceae bacterium]
MKFHFEPDDIEILQGIVEESTEHLNGIEEGVLKLEAEFAPEHLDHVFRALHSVKGVAGFVDYTPIKDTAHVLESFLSDMKKGVYTITSEITDLLLRGIDILNLHVAQLGQNLQENDTSGQNPIDMDIDEYDFQEFVHGAENIRQSTLEGGGLTPPNAPAAALPEAERPVELRQFEKLEMASFLEQSRLDFLEEVHEHLDSIEKCCVLLEKEPSNQELLNAIMRGFHSIKGGAGVILSMQEDQASSGALNQIKNLTHRVETLMQTYRNFEMEVPSGVVDLILETIDRSAALTKSIEMEQDEHLVIDDLMERLQIFTPGEEETPGEEVPQAQTDHKLPRQLAAFANITRQALESMAGIIQTARTDAPVNPKRLKQYLRALTSISKSARQLDYTDLVHRVESHGNRMEGLDPGKHMVNEELVTMMRDEFEQIKDILEKRINDIENLSKTPEEDYADKKLGEILLAEKKISQEDLDKALKTQRRLGEVLVDSGLLRKEDIDLALAKQTIAREQTREPREQGPANSDVGGQSIRVSQDKMNRLMNMIGELLISKNQIFHLAGKVSVEYELPALAREVKSVAFDISRISDELQDAIMSARMLPLRGLFQRYPRTIRDTARKVGKQADLIVEGEETELDKTVLEAINDPLVHMLRNAVDHGIEMPEDRRRVGKPEAGTVLLRARYQGNNVVIEIKDDGRGMNPEELKAKALRKGLITPDQIETLTIEDTFRLIFAPGFSTKEEVSELSGRGVGMDVVKTNVEKVGGSVSMTSVINEGSLFTLKIPLSMSIIKGLMVKCSGQQFVLPLDCIEETVKLPASNIRHYKDLLVADIRGEILHLIRLHNVLNLPQSQNQGKKTAGERVSVVVVEIDGNRFGLIVDSFHKEQEFVVKALTEELARLKIYTGASILGDGDVVLILNPVQLFNLFLHSRRGGPVDGNNYSTGQP